ncbi:MAG: Glycosyl transferase group 1 [candidate division WWE3 bacterium GW2011_GWA2_42_9]|nr:MAG: Glycosyl transferase group 1 [candidate division WWE3 bacterium GW2011_GWA2_42_9]
MDHGGGDKVQVENTARELRNLGIDVEIRTDEDFIPQNYDLIHLFQLDWTPETYLYAQKAHEAGKPIILSPIHHSIKEVKRFDDEYVFDFRRISKVLFNNQFHRDTFKNVYRSLTDPKKETFGVKIDAVKVPNGVSRNFSETDAETENRNPLNLSDYIICVGRIEPRKNQLAVISAVEKLREEMGEDLQLVLIGVSTGLKHFEYGRMFNDKKSECPWIHHIEKVPYQDMPAYYRNAKVGVSASWFETTGLTSLESLFCGANAVASGERAKEYLKDYASYCDPGSVDSIAQAIKTQLKASRPQIADELRKEYTWEKAAAKTLEVYREVLKKWQKSQ